MGVGQTKRSFSFKWRNFVETMRKPEIKQRYVTIFKDRFDIKDFSVFADSKILDAGCGTGWLLQFFDGLGCNVWAIDNSDSIKIALKYFHYPWATILRDDMTTFNKQRDFDFIIAYGTCHHTKNPKKTIEHLTSLLKEGGELWGFMYAKKAEVREFLDTEIRKATTKMSFKECIEFSRIMTNVGRELSKTNVKINGMPLQRWIYWNVMKCYWNEVGYDYSLIVNFDWYSPKLASRHTEEELKSWFDENGLFVKYFRAEPNAYYFKVKKV